MHAIILAGGFGTRLKSAVPDLPKPLAPMGGRPFLAWLIDALAAQGITGVTLCVHHQWEKIRDYFTNHASCVPISYVIEETPLGTGGAMAHALKSRYFSGPLLALNGDSYVKLDYPSMLSRHVNTGARLTIALREVPDTQRYGRVEMKNGIITSFGEGDIQEKGLINAGVYIMEPEVLMENGLPDAFSFEKDFLPPRLRFLKPRGFMAEDYFIDIGVPEDYARACRELPAIISGSILKK